MARHLLCNYISDMTNRWLSIRVEILGNFIVFFAAVFAFYSRDSLSAGVIGLSISYAMQMIDGFGWTIRTAGELESDSVALERVREYEELPQEAAWESPGGEKSDWLTDGVIQFREFSCRYRSEFSTAEVEVRSEVMAAVIKNQLRHLKTQRCRARTDKK